MCNFIEKAVHIFVKEALLGLFHLLQGFGLFWSSFTALVRKVRLKTLFRFTFLRDSTTQAFVVLKAGFIDARLLRKPVLEVRTTFFFQ